MKTNKIITIVLLLVASISFITCVDDADYAVPQDLNGTENAEVTKIEAQLNDPNANLDSISVAGVKKLFVSGSATEITSELVLIGYVSSSDRTGNFFKEIFVQDKAEEAENAVKIALDLNDTYNKFNVGRKVYIKLQGLFIGETRSGNGIITIGRESGNLVDDISPSNINSVLFRSAITAEIKPKKLNLSEIGDAQIGTMVQIENAQFNRSLRDENFTDSTEQFDTQRAIESCSENGASILLETSSFAAFKSAPLPWKSFTINAIVSKTFNGSDIVLVLNDKNDIVETGDRCDPDFVECTTPSGGGADIFLEDFENFGSFAAEGWTAVNVEDKSTEWRTGSFSGNTYAQITAFRSGEDSETNWLVSPAINMDNTTGEELSFDIQANFDNGTILSVMVSTDFNGDPTTATWRPIDALIPSGPSNGFGSFEKVGPINISCIDGQKVHIGFLYESSDPSATTRYHVDNVRVTGN